MLMAIGRTLSWKSLTAGATTRAVAQIAMHRDQVDTWTTPSQRRKPMAENKIAAGKPINSGEHDPERLDKTLAYFAKSGLINPTDDGRRIGKPNRSPEDPYARAKYVSEKVRRFFEDCMIDEGLVNHPAVAGVTAPMEVIYVIELLWLNVANAENIPATKAEIESARQAAFDYYEKNR